MTVSIAHPQTKGRRKRAPVIHSDVKSESGPTPLEIAIANANAKSMAKRTRKSRPASVIDLRTATLAQLDALEKLDPNMTESEYGGYIIAYAALVGGWVADCKRQGMDAMHTPAGVTKAHWDKIGNGVQDWILLHEERLLLVLWEIKRDRKASPLRERQVRWRSGVGALASMYPNLVCKVISPSDWPYIKAILRGH